MKSLYNKNKPNAFSRSSKFAYGCDLYVYIRRELNYTMVVYSFKKKSESFALYTYISSNARTRISI